MQMIYRCYAEHYPRYEDYGARGVRVCDRWVLSFEAFLEDVGERPDGHTLDRIDCEGDYHPGNVRWATRVEQANNKRNTRYVEYEGRMVPLGILAASHGLSPDRLRRRLFELGWSVERAVTTPVRPYSNRRTA